MKAFLILSGIFYWGGPGLAQECGKAEKIFRKEIHSAGLKGFLKGVHKQIDQKETRLKRQCSDCALKSTISSKLGIDPESAMTCQPRYLRTHVYKKTLALPKKSCNGRNLKKSAADYISRVLTAKNQEGVLLWEKCPGNCSFDVDYITQMDESKCESHVDLRVRCAHKAKGSALLGNIYDVKVEYTGACKKPEILSKKHGGMKI